MVKKLYPFTGHYLALNGHRYHYLDEGQGEPVVMVHGNPTWSFYYRNLVLALRNGYRTIVPDHIGCGRSDKPNDSQYEYTLKSRADDLEALLDQTGARSRQFRLLRQHHRLQGGDVGGQVGCGVRHGPRFARRFASLQRKTGL